MSKRYTDTEKWKKKWYRELGATLRDVRQFILDQCTHYGVWEVDFETVRHFTGHKITLVEVARAFQGKVIEYEKDKLFIPAFVHFQYGELREDSRPHQSVIKELVRAKLWDLYQEFSHLDCISSQTLTEGLPKGYLTLKDKDKEQDKAKAQDQDKDRPPILNTDERTAEFLASVKHDVQNAWLALYEDKPWVEREVKAAYVWTLSNPARAPKSNNAAFLSGWLKRGWEAHRKTLPTKSVPKVVPASGIRFDTIVGPVTEIGPRTLTSSDIFAMARDFGKRSEGA